MSEPFKVGDRVVIRAVRHPNCERYVGRTGRIEHVFISPDLKGTYKVVLDRGFAARIIASAVEAIPERDRRELSTSEHALYTTENHDWRDNGKDQSDFTTGETVRIVRPRDNDGRRSIGKVGVIENIMYLNGRPDTFFVRVGEEMHRAAWVEEAPTDAPTSELDRRRTQAMEFARRILGTDADLDDLLRLAEWALNEQTERVTFNPGGVIFTPNDAETTRLLAEGLVKSGRIVAEPQETPRPPAGLQIIDRDGDGIGFHYNSDLPDVVALVDVYDEDGGSHNAFIRPADADRIIAFLQDAKAAKATQELEKATALTETDLDIGGLSVSMDLTSDDDVVAVATDRSEYLKEGQIDELIVYLQAAKLRHVARREARNT